MARSHLCMSCGRDLGSIGVRYEPRYGLPIVACPGCGTIAIRRRHPLEHGLRTVRRAGPVVVVLILQTFVLAFLAAAVTGACTMTADAALAQDELSLRPTGAVVSRLALIFGLIPLMLGAWLTAGLIHWRRWAAWLAFFGLVALLLALEPIGLPLLVRGFDAAGLPLPHRSVNWTLWTTRLSMLAPIALLALIGIPLGTALITIDRRVRRRRARGVAA